jgi:hypothetical protein
MPIPLPLFRASWIYTSHHLKNILLMVVFFFFLQNKVCAQKIELDIGYGIINSGAIYKNANQPLSSATLSETGNYLVHTALRYEIKKNQVGFFYDTFVSIYGFYSGRSGLITFISDGISFTTTNFGFNYTRWISDSNPLRFSVGCDLGLVRYRYGFGGSYSRANASPDENGVYSYRIYSAYNVANTPSSLAFSATPRLRFQYFLSKHFYLTTDLGYFVNLGQKFRFESASFEKKYDTEEEWESDIEAFYKKTKAREYGPPIRSKYFRDTRPMASIGFGYIFHLKKKKMCQ